MRELRKFLEQERLKNEHSHLLEDAVLSGDFFGYALYRLRYYLGRLPFELLLRFIELLILVQFFEGDDLYLSLAALVCFELWTGFVWGGLEELRERVRFIPIHKRFRQLPEIVSAWMTFTAVLGVFFALLFSALLLLFFGNEFHPALGWFLAIIAGRIAVEPVVRTFHSGLYALRRIYRPFWSLLVPQAAGFALIALLSPTAGIWSVPIGYSFSVVLHVGLTWHYARRVYEVFRIEAIPWISWRAFRKSKRSFLSGEFLRAGAAASGLRLDSLIFLAFVIGIEAEGSKDSLVHFLFLIAPLIRSSSSWAQLFYFDLRRLRLHAFSSLRAAFERDALRFSILIALALGAVAALLAAAFFSRDVLRASLLLLPAFLAQSVFSISAIRAFVLQRYTNIILSVLLFGLSAGFLLSFEMSALSRCIILSGAASLLGALLLLLAIQEKQEGQSRLMPLFEWIRHTAALEESVSGGYFKLDPEMGWYDRQRFGYRFANELSGGGSAAFTMFGEVFWREPEFRPRKELVMALSAGTALDLHQWKRVENGCALLQELRQSGAAPFQDPPQDLKQDLKALAASGSMIPLHSGESVSGKEKLRRRFSLAQAIQWMWQVSPEDAKRQVYAVLGEAGAIEALFMVPGRRRSSTDELARHIMRYNTDVITGGRCSQHGSGPD